MSNTKGRTPVMARCDGMPWPGVELGWLMQHRLLFPDKGAFRVVAEIEAMHHTVHTSYMGDPVHGARHPDFSVFGKVLVGDVALIEANPHQIWIRRTPVLIAVPTTFYSNRNASLDRDGGASIELMSDEPRDPGAGPVDSGQLTITAYGRGTGPKANVIRFLSRSRENRIEERMRITGDGQVGIGTDQPAATLDVRGNIRVGGSEQATGVLLFDHEGQGHRLVVRGGQLRLETPACTEAPVQEAPAPPPPSSEPIRWLVRQIERGPNDVKQGPGNRNMIVWARNEDEAMARGREVLMREAPEFELDRYCDGTWDIRPLREDDEAHQYNNKPLEPPFSLPASAPSEAPASYAEIDGVCAVFETVPPVQDNPNYAHPRGEPSTHSFQIGPDRRHRIQLSITKRGNLYLYLGSDIMTCHDGSFYGFGQMQDCEIGSLWFCGTGPRQFGMRHVPLKTATPTLIYSNRNQSSDAFGGASINLFSDEDDDARPPRGRPVNSGYLNLMAYGRGCGERANSIRFRTRSGPNEATERVVIDGEGRVGIGTTRPAAKLHVNGDVAIGSPDRPAGLVLHDENGSAWRLTVRGGQAVLEPSSGSQK